MRYLAVWWLVLIPGVVVADDWPQWLGAKRDGVWRETGIADKLTAKEIWRKPLGAGYAGPAVAAGKVYVLDRIVPEGAKSPKNPFDRETKVPGSERIVCLDEKTGDLIWKHEYECIYRVSYASGPRCTPTVDGKFVYALGTMGDFFCLDAEKGKVIWEKHFLKDYNATLPLWGYAAHPLVYGDLVICLVGGSEDRMVVAFDKTTGKEIWKSLTTNGDCGYCPPTVFTLAGKEQLIIWHPDAVVGLNPTSGAVLWTEPFKSKAALTAPTPRLVGKDQFLVTAFYNGSMLLKFDPSQKGPTVVWKGKSNSERPAKTDGLHSIMPTPVYKDGYIYGVCSYGQLRCLEAATGKRVWESMKATRLPGKDEDEITENDRWANAFIIEQGDRYFLFNEHGELILAKLSPKGYEELDRKKLLEPTNKLTRNGVLWMHPAFANKNIYARNDKEIACFSLAK